MNIKEIKNEFLSEVYYKIEHDSGLTIYVMPKENHKSTYAVFSVNYGSVDTAFSKKGEEITQVPEGIAHFLEHKLFESEEIGAFELYAKTGAYSNAYTSFDRTGYLFSCSDNFPQSLEVLLNFVKSPYFTQQTVEKEQGIIGQEIKMYQDNPDWQVLFNLLRALYKENPVRIDIAGTVESISNISADLLYKCYETFYNNANAVLAVAGNVTKEEVIKIADKCLKKEEKIEIERHTPTDTGEISEKYVEQDMGVGIKKFNLGFRETPKKKTDIEENILMSIVLELICGKSTEIYSELLEKELINSSFYAENFIGRGFSAVIFGGESNEPEKLRDLLLERIRFVKENGFDEKAFEEIRRLKYGGEITALDNVETLATGLVGAHFGEYNIFDIFETYKKITVEDANALVKKKFDETKCVLSVIK